MTRSPTLEELHRKQPAPKLWVESEGQKSFLLGDNNLWVKTVLPVPGTRGGPGNDPWEIKHAEEV